MQASVLKTIGYVISTISVLMLGIVAWETTAHDLLLRGTLLVGIAGSIAGMALRWVSYRADEREPDGPRPRTTRA